MAITAFETEACSRCGGSGEYSYNQIDGTKCFGCGGNGRQYTARGHQAHQFYVRLMQKRAADFAVGETYKYDHCQRRITAIGPDTLNPGSIRIDSRGFCLVTGPDMLLQLVPAVEVRDAALKQALDFQASLTKAGKPRKVAANG